MDAFRDEQFAQAVDVGAEAKPFGQRVIGLLENQQPAFLDGIREPCDVGRIVKRFAADDDGLLDLFEIDGCIRLERLQFEHGNFLQIFGGQAFGVIDPGGEAFQQLVQRGERLEIELVFPDVAVVEFGGYHDARAERMGLQAGVADGAGDWVGGDRAGLQFGFEGLADALATPVNGDDTRLACIVDEHNGLPDGFALPVAVRLVRDGIQRVIFIGPSDERASVLVPTEEGFSERCRLPAFRSRFPVDELRRHRVHPVREEAWLLQDAEVVHNSFGIDVLGSFPEGALIPWKHGGDAESPVGTPVVRRVFRHDLMVERIFRDRFVEFGPGERLFCLPKLLLMRDGVAAENGGLAVGVFAEFGRGVFGGPEALEGLCPPDERGAAVA